MRKNILFMLAFYSAALIQYSCDSFVKTVQDTKNGQTERKNKSMDRNVNTAEINPAGQTSSSPKKAKTDFLADTSALQLAEDALRDRPELQNKEVFIYRSIQFYDDYRIYIKIQNPDNPQYVDDYHYRDGQWSAPKPVVLSKRDIVSRDIVNLNQLPFKNAHRVYRTIHDKLAEIESKSKDYHVYAVIANKEIRWYPRSIKSDRSRYNLEFNADGSLKSFEQD